VAEASALSIEKIVSSPWLPRTVVLLLTVLLAWSLAQLSWRLFGDGAGGEAVAPRPLPAAQRSPGAPRGPDIAALTRAALFGREVVEAGPAAQRVVDAPKTTLNVKLHGIVYSDNPRYARAIIEQPGSQRSHFKVGDELRGGAKLHAIYVDRVILERAGRYETLELKIEEANLQVARADLRTVTPGSGIASDTASVLRDYRERFVREPLELAQQFASEPYRDENNELVGFRIKALGDERLLESLGIQESDIITEVNGIPLDDPMNVMKLMEELPNAQSLNLQFLRDGQPNSVQVDVGS
jgi:general secretion pathway protein C